jgi:hypothetical protein
MFRNGNTTSDDAAPALLALGVAQLARDRLRSGQSAFFASPHQPRITRDVGRQGDGSGSYGFTGRNPQAVFQKFAMLGIAQKCIRKVWRYSVQL